MLLWREQNRDSVLSVRWVRIGWYPTVYQLTSNIRQSANNHYLSLNISSQTSSFWRCANSFYPCSYLSAMAASLRAQSLPCSPTLWAFEIQRNFCWTNALVFKNFFYDWFQGCHIHLNPQCLLRKSHSALPFRQENEANINYCFVTDGCHFPALTLTFPRYCHRLSSCKAFVWV